MNGFKSIIIALLLGCFVQVMQADFFSLQLLKNPETGQKIHIFNDTHDSKDGGVTTKKQQEDFIAYVKSLGPDTVVLVEDAYSYLNDKGILPKSVQEYEKAGSYWITPLSGLSRYCLQHGIKAINIDCRESEMEKIEIGGFPLHNDAVMNKWFKKCFTLFRNSESFSKTIPFYSSFLAETLFQDLKTLQIIRDEKAPNIVIAVGAVHSVLLNNALIDCGFFAKKLVIDDSLEKLQKWRALTKEGMGKLEVYWNPWGVFSTDINAVKKYKTLLTEEHIVNPVHYPIDIAAIIVEQQKEKKTIADRQLKAKMAEVIATHHAASSLIRARL